MYLYIGYNNQRVIESILYKKYFNILFYNKLIAYIEMIHYGHYTY